MVFEDMGDFYEVLGDLPITLILVYASLDKVLKHLIQRNAPSVAHEKWVFASALRQYYSLYRPAYTSDDPIVDTINVAEFEPYFIYLRKESYWEPEKIEGFIRLFVTHFAQVDTREVCITPMMDYKIIVHTTHDSAYECAQHILQQL